MVRAVNLKAAVKEGWNWLSEAMETPAEKILIREVFTPRVQRVVEFAHEEAERLGHHFTDSVHLLLGLLRLEQGVAFNVLRNLGVEPDAIRSALAKELVGYSRPLNRGRWLFGEDGKRALVEAAREAKRLKHTYIGTEHILLGLLLKGDAASTTVLNRLSVDVERVRLAVLKELDPNL